MTVDLEAELWRGMSRVRYSEHQRRRGRRGIVVSRRAAPIEEGERLDAAKKRAPRPVAKHPAGNGAEFAAEVAHKNSSTRAVFIPHGSDFLDNPKV